jgi:predicted nucleic acid-binding Zn finger protein
MQPYYGEMLKKIKNALSSPDPENYIRKFFKKRGSKAIKLVKNNGIKKVHTLDEKEIWIAEGQRGRYLVIPMYYCSCNGFATLIASGENEPCYHLIAQAYAEFKKMYLEEYTNKKYKELILELLQK